MAKKTGDVTLDELNTETGGDLVAATGDAGTNGEIPKTRKPRVTMEMRGLANVTVDKETHARIAKAAELAGTTIPDFFAKHLRDDFHALLDGQLTRDGNTLPSLKDRLMAERNAALAEAAI